MKNILKTETVDIAFDQPHFLSRLFNPNQFVPDPIIAYFSEGRCM